jgi:hypothetical protein
MDASISIQSPSIDPALIAAWLAARSVSRDLPLPVPDRGGLRVETHSDKETRRWVFARMTAGLSELAHEISAPRHFIKLCGSGQDLSDAVPRRWQLQAGSYVMMAGAVSPAAPAVPHGYSLESHRAGAKTHVRILAPDDSLAASGHAAETADVFIYDRIVTAPAHRRQGLGRVVMAALAAAKSSRSTPQMLVASEDGRKLYTSLGWSVCSPYATVAIPA